MKRLNQLPQLILGFAMSIFVLAACEAEKSDADIKASVDKELKENSDFTGVTATVDGAVVTLRGDVANESIKNSAVDEVEDVEGVKSVINEITITSPNTSMNVPPDDNLKSSVDNAIKEYPSVKATVEDGVITLSGEIKKNELQDLMKELNELNPKKIENNLEVKA